MVNSKFPLPSLNRERYHVLWWLLMIILRAWCFFFFRLASSKLHDSFTRGFCTKQQYFILSSIPTKCSKDVLIYGLHLGWHFDTCTHAHQTLTWQSIDTCAKTWLHEIWDGCRDPHIILFSHYYSILELFYYSLNVHPLFLSFPMTWVHTEHWVPGWMPAFCQKGGLSWHRHYVLYTGWKELENEDNWAEKAGWWQSQTRLTHCSRLDLDVDVNDASMISGHCIQLDYYSIQITQLEFMSHYSHIYPFLFKCLLFKRNSLIMCRSLDGCMLTVQAAPYIPFSTWKKMSVGGLYTELFTYILQFCYPYILLHFFYL